MASRKHLVLVPGFVGFDALGTVRYYAGVTTLFREWSGSPAPATQTQSDATGSAEPVRGPVATLHYFDNFPTASVENRALRLKVYLAKLIARGDIAGGDELTLLGHSTGGLDIRELLVLLTEAPDAETSVDDRLPVRNCVVLRMIKKLVFISVPQYGTNIADYVHSYRATVMLHIARVRDALALNRAPLSQLRALLGGFVDPRADLLRALIDTLNETDEHAGATQAQRANEREARYQVLLWLDHMANEFDAIDDLRSGPAMLSPHDSPAGAATRFNPLERVGRGFRAVASRWRRPAKRLAASPAHFTVKERAEEVARWPKLSIRSYATFVKAERVKTASTFAEVEEVIRKTTSFPLSIVSGSVNIALEKLGLLAVAPDLLKGAAGLAILAPLGGPALAAIYLRPSLLFEAAYAACARESGPFQAPEPAVDTTYFAPSSLQSVAFGLSKSERITFSSQDNDGIANTLSMFWPRPSETLTHEIFVVEADHADIIGHHSLMPERGELERDRRYASYDLFESKSGFKADAFRDVWTDIFEFAFGEESERASRETGGTRSETHGASLD